MWKERLAQINRNIRKKKDMYLLLYHTSFLQVLYCKIEEVASYLAKALLYFHKPLREHFLETGLAKMLKDALVLKFWCTL